MNPLSIPAAELLAIHTETGFVADPAGRALYERDPDRPLPPRLFLAGCSTGNTVLIRADVSTNVAGAIEAVAADEPPFVAPEGVPVHREEYLALLAQDAPAASEGFGLSWWVPEGLGFDHPASLVYSATPEAEWLLDRLVRQGLPEGLRGMGFRGPEDFWEPWCIALDGEEMAAIAFTARFGPRGAEVGLNTIPAFRGRGLGAAATTGWARHPALEGRIRFFSTSRANRSSQRVTERLGLSFLGCSYAAF